MGPSWRVEIPSALDQMSVSHNINKCNKCSQFEYEYLYVQPANKLIWGNMKTHRGEMRNAPIAIIAVLLIQITFRSHSKTHSGWYLKWRLGNGIKKQCNSFYKNEWFQIIPRKRKNFYKCLNYEIWILSLDLTIRAWEIELKSESSGFSSNCKVPDFIFSLHWQ